MADPVILNLRCERCGCEFSQEDTGTVKCPNCELESEPAIFIED